MNRVRSLIYLFICALMIVSCEHKDLCYHHPHQARVRINTDWSKFKEETPTGMTVMVYSQDADQEVVATQHTNTTTHALMYLPDGLYSTIVYNQSHTEFGSLSFRGLSNYNTAEVYANPATTRWYTRTDGTRVVTEPEWVGTDRLEDMIVTPEMVNETWMELENSKSRNITRNGFLIGTLVPRNIIYTIYVKVLVKGIHNLRSARASMDGLAEGYFLGRGVTSTEKVVQLMEEWTMTQDKVDPTQGYIESKITCFGLPHGHASLPEENFFELQTLLVDNKTILKFPFQVGDKFKKNISEEVQLTLYLDLELDEPLPDVEPAGGSSGGFSAEVEDWGPEEDIDINM